MQRWNCGVWRTNVNEGNKEGADGDVAQHADLEVYLYFEALFPYSQFIKPSIKWERTSLSRHICTFNLVLHSFNWTYMGTVYLQGDQAAWAKLPVDIKSKVPFWPGLPWPGQAKTELLSWCQREVWLKLLGHTVVAYYLRWRRVPITRAQITWLVLCLLKGEITDVCCTIRNSQDRRDKEARNIIGKFSIGKTQHKKTICKVMGPIFPRNPSYLFLKW